jgi:hypothetical protein
LLITAKKAVMLSKEDNEFMCKTGPGTPMGELLRRYWTPALVADIPFNAIRSEEAVMSPTDEWRLLGASAGEDEGITGSLTVKPVYVPDAMGGEYAIERRVEKPTYE